MKNRRLSKILICVLFLVNLIPLVSILSYKPWGYETEDGSEIQVYWESEVQEKDYRIPQDMDLLETDKFYVWIRSTVFANDSADNFTVRLFGYRIETIEYWDSRLNATRTRQEKVFDVFKDEITLEVEAEDSPYEWSDERFGIIVVNQETFPSFKNTNQTERVQVIFHERIFEFDHWTNIAEIEVTKTHGQFNVELMWWIGWSIIIIFVFIFFAYLISKKAGLAPPPPSWYFWPMLASVVVGMMVIFVLMIGLPIEVVGRTMSILPPLWIPILAGIWLDFYLPNRFSGKVRPYIFLEVDGDTQVIVGIWPLWGYFKGEQLEFVKDKTSYKEFGKRLLVGGFPQPDWIFNPKVPIKSKNKELPHIFGIKSYEEHQAKFEKREKWWIGLICLILLSLMALTPLFTGTASIPTGIASILLFLLAGGIFVITAIRLTSPRLEVEQILHQSEITVLTNIQAVKAMKEFAKKTLDEHMKFVAESEKGYFDRLKAAVKRYADSYRGETKKSESMMKEKLEKLKLLEDVVEWERSKKLIEKSKEKSKKPS